MANVVGTLQVDLVAGTATFTRDMNKAGDDSERNAKRIQTSFDRIEFREAKGSIALLGEEIGVHLPRHVQTFLAKLPGVATLMAAAFPALAVVAIGEKIFEAAEKVSHFGEEIRKMNHEFDEAALSLARIGESMELNNLRLEDQIAKLEGRPVKNKGAEALIEMKRRADQLYDALDKALRKQEELLEKQGIGIIKSIFTGQSSTSGLKDAVVPVIQAIEDARAAEQLANAEGRDDAEKTAKVKKDAAIASLQAILVAEQKNIDKDKQDAINLNKGIAVGMSGNTRGTLTDAEMQASAEKGVNETYRVRQAQLNDLRLTFALYSKDLKKVAEGNELVGKKDDLEQKVSAYDVLRVQQKKALDEHVAQLEAELAAAKVSYAQRAITAQQWGDIERRIAGQVFQANLDYYSKLESAAVGSKRGEIEAERQKYIADAIKTASNETAAIITKNESAIDKMREDNFKHSEARGQQEVDEALKNAGKRNKELTDLARVGTDTSSMERYRDAVLSGADALKEYNVQLQLTEFIKKHPDLTISQMAQVESALRTQASLQEQIAAAEHVRAFDRQKDLQREIDILNQLRSAAMAAGKDTLAYDAAIHQAQLQKQTDQINELLATGRVRDGVKAFLLDYQMQSQITGKKVEQYLIQTTDQFASTLSKALVEGGADWRQFGITAIESLVQMGIQALLSATIIKALKAILNVDDDSDANLAKKQQQNFQGAMSDAALASGNTFAMYTATSLLPVAAGMAAAAYGIGAGIASLALFDKGGVVPNTGIALVHEGEGIFSPAITGAILASVSAGPRAANAGTRRPPSITYAPQFTTWNKRDVGSALEDHKDVLQAMVRRELARL